MFPSEVDKQGGEDEGEREGEKICGQLMTVGPLIVMT